MVWYLAAAMALFLTGAVIVRCGIDFKGGAGAPGSILMLVGAVVMLISVFVFGMAAGVAIAAPAYAFME